MELILPLEERSICQIYLDSQETMTYMIPVYQRNYAWEEDEIAALIKDVYDSFKNTKETYYIGTLVTYKRGDSVYEVIDGQQRLTTIFIILKVLGIKNEEIRNKLTYGARKASASTIEKLEKLVEYPHLGEEVDDGIINGYKYANNAVITIVDEQDRERFKQYFLNKVHIIHYRVPKDVDLNHYFEVMNSRGEQLEKHEIVKSMLSQHLNKIELATFSRVWEACSEMNIYIQQAFPNADKIFGSQLHKFVINSFEGIPGQKESDGKATLFDLLQQPIGKVDESSDLGKSDKFQPIIDFPNFLLIVLKVTLMKYEGFEPVNFTLDDKELLNEFSKAFLFEKNKALFAKKFAFNLLKAKFLLDNYIVHHSLDNKEQTGDNPWKLQYYFKRDKGYPVNLASPSVQDELVHLQSMFEVSFTPKQRKNYLFYCMVFLFDNNELKETDYLEFLRNLANNYFYHVYLNHANLNERNQPVPNAFDNALLGNRQLKVGKIEVDRTAYRLAFEKIYEQGRADVPLFVFNYTDYILWKKYADELRGDKTKKGSKERNQFFEELGCSDFELDPFNNFYFSRTRKSLEHYYPQAKAGDGKLLSSDQINCFGNFAMIGSDANSSGSNWNPIDKKNRYLDTKSNQVSVASLKFRIMLQKCQDNYDNGVRDEKLKRPFGLEWNYKDIQEHQRKMLDIIFK